MDNRTRQREMMYCHECENEWYRDEHGLACPECQSDFTEVIESGHDPREDIAPEHTPEPPSALAHPLHNHNPWAAPDPDEEEISDYHWNSTGPGGATFHATFTRTVSPPGRNHGGEQPANPLMQHFTGMLGNMLGAQPPGAFPQAPQRRPSEDLHQGEYGRPGSATGNTQGPRIQVRVGPHYTWQTTGRATGGLHPRNANQPQPQAQVMDDLPHILQAVFGGPGGMPAQAGGAGGDLPPGHPFAGMGPLGGLFAGLFNPANMQHGDAVYSQEALDRVISQMMEQNVTGNAPGPASAEAIASLPQKSISKVELGDTGTAECSICMDEVKLGDKVTVLPCSHWFHGDCVKAWLLEHDTCPQCRQGIMPKDAPADAQRSRRPDEVPRHDRTWGQGEGTRDSPFTLSDSPPQTRRSRSRSAGPSSSPNASGSNNDGLFNRMRNAFGGGGGAS